MEDSKKARKFEGVMLALRIEDAKEIKLLLNDRSYCNDELTAKISNRIDKQIEKRAIEKAQLCPQISMQLRVEEKEDTAQMQSLDAAREEDAESEKYAQENRVK